MSYNLVDPFVSLLYTSGNVLDPSPITGTFKLISFNRLKAKGAQFGSKMGWERPNYFLPSDVASSSIKYINLLLVLASASLK